MITTEQLATIDDLEDAVFHVANHRFDGFDVRTETDPLSRYPRPTVIARTGHKYTDRAISLSFIDDDPTCGVQVDYTTGNGVSLVDATVGVRVLAGKGEQLGTLLAALLDLDTAE